MMLDVMLISSIGLGICIYTYFIERNLKKNEQYKAVCDISSRVSCTKTFKSAYAKLFGVSNVYVGILYYVSMIFFGYFDLALFAFLATVIACLASVVLAYILYFKIETLCLLCTSIYVVNALLLFLTYRYL